MSPKKNTGPATKSSSLSWIPWVAVVAVVAVIGIVAVVMAKGSAEDDAKEWDDGAPITVEGESLPALADSDEDQAVGMQVPEISGTSVLDGEPLTLGDEGKGRIYVVTAHWCPHCQNEVPKIVEHIEDSPLPDDVELIGLTTRMDPSGSNYPPSDWLEREDWTFPTLIDDAKGTAA